LEKQYPRNDIRSKNIRLQGVMPVPEKSVTKAQNLKIAESFGVKKTCIATIGGRIEDPLG
jgi:hypothetical protein